ncbi:MAG TPA: type II toxin-antitoxin system VapB family antitoxin [Acidimicrobiales bacterium]|nr:type II toxin-antitoxin system VapB family antitoxin [Acidimicrobiales bacterium]
MARTNIDIDETSCQVVMRRYHLTSKKEAVNMALRLLASEALSVEDARRMRGTGWDGDLDALRSTRVS